MLRTLTAGFGTVLLLVALSGAMILSTYFRVPPWISSVLFVTAISGLGILIYGFYGFRSR
ncbi:MAG TPA: hypothetical protein VHT51_17410 [Micropepsaceae bacterium]|jgi:hypothetical protein|nr:hypothetical protein [Micropepsaceae bacterium]